MLISVRIVAVSSFVSFGQGRSPIESGSSKAGTHSYCSRTGRASLRDTKRLSGRDSSDTCSRMDHRKYRRKKT